MSEQLTWAHIKRLALRHKKPLILANAMALLAVLCTVPIPLLLPLLVDEVLLGQGAQALSWMDKLLPEPWQTAVGYISLMLAISALLRLASLLFNVVAVRHFARLSKEVIFRLRKRLLKHLQRISMHEYEALGSGKVNAHLLTDLDTVDAFLGEALSRALVALLTLLGTSIILLWMHWQLALLILLLNPIVVLATIKLGKRVKALKKRENDTTAHFAQALSEALEAMHELRASNRQGHFFTRLQDLAREVREHASSAKWKTEVAGRSSGVVFQFGIDAFRAAAMLTVLFSDLSIGQMLAVFSYLWFMVAPVEQLVNLQYAYYAASGALVRLNELLGRAQEPHYPAQKDPFTPPQPVSLTFENVHFSYGQLPVFKGLNLVIAPGETVAVVGASGGGKSTLVQLLLGLYQADQGRILIGDAALEEIGYSAVREQVAVVLQQPALFDASVRANLCMGREHSDEACWQVLEQAQLKAVIAELPKGLDTLLGRFGVRLSGGQRQRLAIARMLLTDPKVVIMDEASSALDTVTEQALHQALDTFLSTRTTLIIAHRLSAVRQATRIVVIEAGVVVEQGSHAELLARGGRYHALYGTLQAP